MEKGTVRAVCFEPSTATQERYNKIAESKSPVKITNFETDNKRKGHPVDVIIRKRTRIDELSEALPFTRRDIFASKGKTTSIGSLKDVQAGQLLSVSALVTNLSAITVVKKRNTGENLTVRECQLTDPTGSIKLVLWQSFVEKVEEGQTYKLTNLRLKTENSKASLVTTQSGCAIDKCEEFPNLNPPKQLPSTKKTERLEMLGTTNVSSYQVCTNCNKKVTLDAAKKTVKCSKCNITVNKRKCTRQFFARVIMKCKEIKIPFTFFHNSLVALVGIYNQTNQPQVDISTASEEELEEVIVSFDDLEVTYDFSTSKVIAIKA